MIGEWESFLLDHAGQWNFPTTGKWRFLCYNNYHPHCTTINLLWFHERDQFPRVVTKLFRDATIPRREFDNLARVYFRAPAWVPRPLHFGRHGAFWALWMEGVPGTRVDAGEHLAGATLRAAVDMIASMHTALREGEAANDGERWLRVVANPLRTVAQFGSSPSVRAGCEELMANSPPDWLRSLPSTPQHGDLFAANLLSDRGKWYVVDWESFGTTDLPFHDVFTLLYSLLRVHGETPDKWKASMVKQVPQLIERYAALLGLSTGTVSRLFPLTLANWFYLQWRDRRREFTSQMYSTIEHYFQHRDQWQAVFVPAAALESAG